MIWIQIRLIDQLQVETMVEFTGRRRRYPSHIGGESFQVPLHHTADAGAINPSARHKRRRLGDSVHGGY